jgi:hypothetical protein
MVQASSPSGDPLAWHQSALATSPTLYDAGPEHFVVQVGVLHDDHLEAGTARKVIAARQAAYRYSLISPLRTLVRNNVRALTLCSFVLWVRFGWLLLLGLVGRCWL